MRKFLSGTALFLLATSVSALPAAGEPRTEFRTPNQIVDAAPAADWVRIAPSELIVMDLAPDAAGRPRRVVIQLMPAPFSQGWVENIRKLVIARWYDGIAVVRVQDNYVVQWGDPDGEVPDKAKPLPKGLQAIPESAYVLGGSPPAGRYVWGDHGRVLAEHEVRPVTYDRFHPPARHADPYGRYFGFAAGMPIALALGGEAPPPYPARVAPRAAWPVHCYGMVGVGRSNSPDTGTGAELYTVIGQAPRQLDRNIALVGRIIDGMENLSALPRGTGELGFYKTAGERTPIVSVRMGNEVGDVPGYEYLSTDSESFAAYVDKRANRKDDFYIQPAGGVDACNVPVPVRRAK